MRPRRTLDLGFLGAIMPLVWLLLLLVAVYSLPPDTTLAAVKQSGVLRVCVPDSFPPLVSRDAPRQHRDGGGLPGDHE